MLFICCLPTSYVHAQQVGWCAAMYSSFDHICTSWVTGLFPVQHDNHLKMFSFSLAPPPLPLEWMKTRYGPAGHPPKLGAPPMQARFRRFPRTNMHKAQRLFINLCASAKWKNHEKLRAKTIFEEIKILIRRKPSHIHWKVSFIIKAFTLFQKSIRKQFCQVSLKSQITNDIM